MPSNLLGTDSFAESSSPGRSTHPITDQGNRGGLLWISSFEHRKTFAETSNSDSVEIFHRGQRAASHLAVADEDKHSLNSLAATNSVGVGLKGQGQGCGSPAKRLWHKRQKELELMGR
jgi:hypothetical protein